MKAISVQLIDHKIKFVNDFLDICLSSSAVLELANIALKFGKAISFFINETRIKTEVIVN